MSLSKPPTPRWLSLSKPSRGAVVAWPFDRLRARCGHPLAELVEACLRLRILKGRWRTVAGRASEFGVVAGKSRKIGEAALDEGLLLGAAPAVNPALGDPGIVDAFVLLRPAQAHRTSLLGVGARTPLSMLIEALFQIPGAPDIEALICAAKEVDPWHTHHSRWAEGTTVR